ncbi:alanine racemase [Macrococcus psychrotolerans]|uniref:Alanine racemase n=1 Tax=Macrococcus psychrotolerans TaxID=3039389 RepID=A0AAU6RF04_9STAP
MEHIYKVLSNTNKDYYIYDLQALEERIESITSMLNHDVYYAVKANSHHRILNTLLPYVKGFEVASIGEIEKVRQISSDAAIIYGGPVKTSEDLEFAITRNVSSVQVESLIELDTLSTLTTYYEYDLNISLRINLAAVNTNATLKMSGATQFGLPEEEIFEAMDIIQDAPHLHFEGLHFHAMSNNLDAQKHVAFIEQALNYQHSAIDGDVIINVGGGIGIDYQEIETFNFEQLCEAVNELPRMKFELGRYIVGPVGYYAANVYDIKTMHHENFVLLNGGTHHFRFPKAWNHHHAHSIYQTDSQQKRKKTLSNASTYYVGKLCTPNDVFGQKYEVDTINTGDWVIFHNAGAYGYDISHINFLSHPQPEIVFVG